MSKPGEDLCETCVFLDKHNICHSSSSGSYTDSVDDDWWCSHHLSEEAMENHRTVKNLEEKTIDETLRILKNTKSTELLEALEELIAAVTKLNDELHKGRE